MKWEGIMSNDPLNIDVAGVNVWTKTRPPEGYIKAEFIRLEMTDYGVVFYVQPDGYKQARISVRPPDPDRKGTLQNWKKIQKSFELPTRFTLDEATFLDKECWIFCEHGSGYNGWDHYCFVSEGAVRVGLSQLKITGEYPETNKNRAQSYGKKQAEQDNAPPAPEPAPPVQHPRSKAQAEEKGNVEHVDPFSEYDPNDPKSGIPF